MAQFQKDGLWIQGGQGRLSEVNEETPQVLGQLGRVMSIRRDSGQGNTQADTKLPRFYQYVQRYTTEGVTPIGGSPVFWRDLDDFIVTADSSLSLGGTTYPGPLAGVFLCAAGATNTVYPAAGKYGFVQVGGPAEAFVTGTYVVGQRLQATGTVFTHYTGVTFTVDSSATQLTPTVFSTPVGICVDAVATSTDSCITILLDVMHNGW